jgi:hypothetical protein
MLSLKPFEQGRKRQRIEQSMEEARMDERVGIQSVH